MLMFSHLKSPYFRTARASSLIQTESNLISNHCIIVWTLALPMGWILICVRRLVRDWRSSLCGWNPTVQVLLSCVQEKYWIGEHVISTCRICFIYANVRSVARKLDRVFEADALHATRLGFIRFWVQGTEICIRMCLFVFTVFCASWDLTDM